MSSVEISLNQDVYNICVTRLIAPSVSRTNLEVRVDGLTSVLTKVHNEAEGNLKTYLEEKGATIFRIACTSGSAIAAIGGGCAFVALMVAFATSSILSIGILPIMALIFLVVVILAVSLTALSFSANDLLNNRIVLDEMKGFVTSNKELIKNCDEALNSLKNVDKNAYVAVKVKTENQEK